MYDDIYGDMMMMSMVMTVIMMITKFVVGHVINEMLGYVPFFTSCSPQACNHTAPNPHPQHHSTTWNSTVTRK